jgi:hypothetical protein
MGEVYKARDNRLNRIVAKDQFTDRFERESAPGGCATSPAYLRTSRRRTELPRCPPLRRVRDPHGPTFPIHGFCSTPREEPDRCRDALAAAEARANEVIRTLAVTMGTNRLQQGHNFLRDRNHATDRVKREDVEGEKRTVARYLLYC